MDDEENLFDDVPESFILCALHQTKMIRERWKFWSGTVPADVSIRLYRLESFLSMNKKIENNIPLNISSNISSSQPFLAEIQTYSSIEQYLNERIEPKHNIILQGPDIQRIVTEEKRCIHFWCCH